MYGLIDSDGHYRVIRCDVGEAGGGVFMLIKRDINISNVDIIAGVEMVCICIVVNSNRYGIIVLYRLPGYSPACLEYSIKMLSCLDTLLTTKRQCLVQGDLNCPNIVWSLSQ